MSKKHFRALAEALRAERPDAEALASTFAQWQRDVEAVVRVCRGSSVRFDSERFLEACGYFEPRAAGYSGAVA